MNVDSSHDVLIVEVYDGILIDDSRGFGHFKEVVMTIVNGDGHEHNKDVQHGSLLQLYHRLGDLCYDTIIKIDRDPASGIKLTDTRRTNCLACPQGKETKNVQSRKDSCLNSSIDVLGHVICCDLKSPMTPSDRLGSMYLINFIDHR